MLKVPKAVSFDLSAQGEAKVGRNCARKLIRTVSQIDSVDKLECVAKKTGKRQLHESAMASLTVADVVLGSKQRKKRWRVNQS